MVAFVSSGHQKKLETLNLFCDPRKYFMGIDLCDCQVCADSVVQIRVYSWENQPKEKALVYAEHCRCKH